MRKKFYRKGEQHKIENYEEAKKDNFIGWVIHHRLETDLDGNETHKPESLERLGMYYHRPYFELIYMKRSEHVILHNSIRTVTDESKKKQSNSMKKAFAEGRINVSGERNGMYGKIPWNKGKGKPKHKETPEERLIRCRKNAAGVKGMLWWNDGTTCIRCRTCPGEGFIRGRLK